MQLALKSVKIKPQKPKSEAYRVAPHNTDPSTTSCFSHPRDARSYRVALASYHAHWGFGSMRALFGAAARAKRRRRRGAESRLLPFWGAETRSGRGRARTPVDARGQDETRRGSGRSGSRLHGPRARGRGLGQERERERGRVL